MSTSDQALAPATSGLLQPENRTSPWNGLRHVPLRLSVDIALPPMSLRSLGALTPGQVLSSSVSTADDLIVTIGGSPIGQARFEFMDGSMAMRITRLFGAGRTGA